MTSARKRIALLVRKPGLTQDAFIRYWREVHGPLVAATPDYGLYRLKYAQSHIVQSGPIGAPFQFEGLAAVWLPETAPIDFAQTPAYRDRIKPDEERFLDTNKTLGLSAAEQIVVSGNAAIKFIVLSRRDQRLNRREFCEHMGSVYAEAIVKAPTFGKLLRGFRLNHIRGAAFMSGTKPSENQTVDCIQEFWFDSREDLDHAFLSRDYRDIAATHENALISPTSTTSVIARELVFFENGRPAPLASD